MADDTVSEQPPVPPPRPRRPTRQPPPLPVPAATDEGSETVHDAPVHSSEPETIPKATDELTLTPLRAHYLKKSLIQLELQRELSQLADPTSNGHNVSPFSYIGPPFTPPPKSAPMVDLPFIRYMFRRFVLTFPFLAAAPKDFFPSKLQPFLSSLLSRNLGFADNPLRNPDEESDEHTRAKIIAKLEKQLGLLLSSATKLVEPEEVVRLTQSDLDRLEKIAKKRQEKAKKVRDVFEINVICVRTVSVKGRVRSKVHEEFIVRTRRTNHPDIFVSRRYGDFKTLADELRKAHTEELVRPPPPKDRTTVAAPPTSAGPSMTSFAYWTGTGAASNPSPVNESSDSLSMAGSPTTSPPPSSTGAAVRLSREKNRLTLRSYLNSLLASPTLASSPVLRSFLTASPTSLSPEELEDARRREEADRVRDEGRKRFAKEVADRVEGLRGAINNVKGDILGEDGLTRVFGTIKICPNVEDLPHDYRSVLEWGRISLASTIFHQFVASDASSETLASVKRIHGLMPYMLMKGILRLSNPVGMIRGILDLFLAQPFGGRSLLQRMFTSSLSEEVKALEGDIEAVEEKVDDPLICEKLRLFIYAPAEIQNFYFEDAAAEKVNILSCILRSGEEPVLPRAQLHRVMRAHKAHDEYTKDRAKFDDSDDDDGPADEEAWLYEDLGILAKLYARLRDREQLIALIFEGTTSELLKDILTIFYSPLAQVYKAASIADSIGDLQSFMNDLIKTVEQVEELSQEDAHKTVQIFIDLVQRHEQSFYHFVHKVHTKGQGLFDSLMQWIEQFLTFVRVGLGESVSLEFLLPHTGKGRADILKEVDAVALYHYKLKLAYEDKLRRRFGKVPGESSVDADERATQALVDGVVEDLNFDDLIKGDAVEIAADDSDSEFDSETDDESEEGSSEESSLEAEPGFEMQRQASTSQRPHEGSRVHSAHNTTDTAASIRHAPLTGSSKPQSAPPTRTSFSSVASGQASEKALPAIPRGQNGPDRSPSKRTARDPPSRSPPVEPKSSGKKSKKTSSPIEPPELKVIPELVPLFVEMVRFISLLK
ncbi:hypothetical protein SISNIDRAFT_405952 [Sistotremastrum niveocremeum HHB9708]|uniref:PX domain-containing protein n=1 Tax=Sistotremastrum niveocremeum HHB9708 TaxID=1314777 RepID=A0A164Z6G8_9AGAM|nr:hypothetical protein SISNIDRAFT_405952 [Sistotremastrum niveocremeum HHB9708]